MSKERIRDKSSEARKKSVKSSFSIPRSEENLIASHTRLLKDFTKIYLSHEVQRSEESDQIERLFGGAEWDTLCVKTFSDFKITLQLEDPKILTINYSSPGGSTGSVGVPIPSEEILYSIIVQLDEDAEGGLGGSERLIKKMLHEDSPGKFGSESWGEYSDSESVIVRHKVVLHEDGVPEPRQIPLVVSTNFFRRFVSTGSESKDKERFKDILDFIED